MTRVMVIWIVVYVISAAYCYYYNKVAYSKDGVWNLIRPTWIDVMFTLVPIYNTVCAAVCITVYGSPKNKDRTDRHQSNFASEFFKISK